LIRAAYRDASFFCRLSNRWEETWRAMHVLREDGTAACGLSKHGRRVPLVVDKSVPAHDVDSAIRRARNGCRQRWPEFADSA
jgi:hypothetical protein